MFRFWNSDHRGSDKALQVDRPMLDFAKPVQPWISTGASIPSSPPRPLKRRRQSNAAIASPSALVSAVKRSRPSDETPSENASPPQKKVALAPVTEQTASAVTAPSPFNVEKAKEAIEEQFSLEILLKHDELRLINQELAKCQVALEQLRRCHLIPYPVNTPTPEQMLNVAAGSGPSLQPKFGDKLPQWAPPFGVTDGPYARHYAKWLIPDPKFDGIQPEKPTHADSWRVRPAIEGRSTRNSFTDFSASQGKGRPSRGSAGQKLQALSSGYPPPKDKSGPCVLKRSDGQTVKLVCIDCNRENFSSTQGFINHCRIAHKRDFKSHEEAAVHCGHPIEVAEVPPKGAVVEEKPTGPSAPPSGLAHPFTHASGMTDSEACFSVVRRIQQSLELYQQGNVNRVSSGATVSDKSARLGATIKPAPGFSPSTDSPNLSRLLQSRGFGGNLGALVKDAKTKVDFDQLSSPTDDESEDREMSTPSMVTGSRPVPSQATPGMRVPARAVMAPVSTTTRPSSSKGTLAHPMPYVTPIPTPTQRSVTRSRPEMGIDEDMLDVTELSPNTAVSNNAPSLVSDDGEYDDSADSDSASEMGDSIDAESISDVDDIDMDDDHSGARTLRHHGSTGSGAGTRVRLGKGDTKQVNFVGTIKEDGNTKQGHGAIDFENIH
ncbi:hypothetical protein GQX73_g1070 [Xylaria multiplex]|uniref:AHC1-like C2H2 zinc-finger domain-containing protein n=1 Tax=Xylaria multiplex TaxID=323545 RepID=A0A7C8MSC4_9PEZI|nr:hypothetical protein GQX73_g1070 [Xylaria multiplex]